MTDFKVGDRVRVVSSFDPGLLNKEGVVKEIHLPDYVLVDFDHVVTDMYVSGKNIAFYQSQLELVEPDPLSGLLDATQAFLATGQKYAELLVRDAKDYAQDLTNMAKDTVAENAPGVVDSIADKIKAKLKEFS